MFPTGTWKVQTAARRASYRLTIGGRTISLGAATVKGRTVSVAVSARVKRGTYLLVVRDASSRLITRSKVVVR